MTITQKSVASLATVAVGFALALSFFAMTAEAATCPYTWTTNLKQGSSGADVKQLQMFLNMDPATQIAATGAGSPGSETTYFGGLTKAAVIKFQNKYPADILTPNGLTVGNGNFFASSRAKANSLCTSSTSTPTPVPTGTGVAVSAGAQPANSLAPQGASRVPFTRFTLTAGNDGDVVINSVQVQRTGFGQDAAFAGVILIDEATGMQVGTAKTFNSNHQAAIGGTMTIPRGTTKTFLVAGNMAASLASYAGEAPAISVVAINTTATVSGTLPITGAYHTTNATLTVGSLQLDVTNAFASNSTVTKEIGTTAYRFTGFRLTAGSAEDVSLKSITFNQAGSVSASDLANVMVNVAGTNYPTTLSADGRYYTATFGSGILIGKGNQVDVYVQADVVGSNASGRTVIFDVDRTTDIFGTGVTYGYGISPSTSGGSSVPSSRGNATETTGTPYVYAAQITISGAAITSIAKANEVPAQNIAINVSNQPLGGYVVDIRGEAITVASTVVTFATSTASLGTGGTLTNLTIVNENGSVVAGPVDATCTSSCTATFSDTITYPTGRHVYTIRGKVPSTANNGAVITATTANGGWTTVRGETTGNTISLPTFTVTMNSMTVKSGAMAVGEASSPASQTIVPGGSGVLFVNFQFDASQSGEDVRFSSVPVILTVGGSAASTELTSCQLFDGSTALNTGSGVLNPSGSSPVSATIVLDNPVTVAKGSVKTLGLRCNVSGSATNNGTFSFVTGAASAFSFSGATSGTTITNTSDTSSPTITVTVGAGAVTVATDAASPSYKIAPAGTSDVVAGVYKFRASNENVSLTRLGLTLSNTASSTSGDLVKATIWDGATKVGEAFFSGSATTATSTFTTPVTLTRDTDKSLTIKLDLADIGTSQAVTFSGHLVAVNYLNAEGVGQSSGSTFVLSSAAGSTSVAGVRVMKSSLTLSLDTLPSTGVVDGRLMRFRVTADAKGPVGIAQLSVNLATTSATVTNVTVYGFSDSGYSNPISGVASDGNLQQSNDATVPVSGTVAIGVANSSGATAIQVPAGETRYFEVRGSVSGVTTGGSVTTKVLGSSAFPSTAATVGQNPLLTVAGVVSADATAFIWSPNSTTTASQGDQDWTNGFGVNGLPSGGLIQTRSQ